MSADDKIREYAGRFPRIDDPLMRAAYKLNVTMSAMVYGPGTADWDQKARQVILNEHTADYLYTAFTPLTLAYVPGSRPVLARLVNRILSPTMNDREKVLAIMRYCWEGFKRDFPRQIPEKVIYLNAMEEEILKLGGGQCEDRSRLIICLCQIAGFPARFVASYSYFMPEQGYRLRGGHAVVEVYLEGGWAFFDSLRPFYCLRPDGKLASLWDLLRNPSLPENQPQSVLEACGRTRDEFIAYRDDNLTRRQVITLTNYYIWDWWRYDWRWVRLSYTPDDSEWVKRQHAREELRINLLTEIGIPREQIK